MPKSYQDLVKRAQAAKAHSHSPYSNFRVGAALLSKKGTIYTGCNIEVSSYGLTVCAERTAVFKAISEGAQGFRAIAISSDNPGFTPPCGACRQVLMDLAGNIDVLLVNARGTVQRTKLAKLLPHAFGRKNLKPRKRR